MRAEVLGTAVAHAVRIGAITSSALPTHYAKDGRAYQRDLSCLGRLTNVSFATESDE